MTLVSGPVALPSYWMLYIFIFLSISLSHFFLFENDLEMWAMIWMFEFPLNSYVEILTPQVMVLMGGTSGGWLNPKGRALIKGIDLCLCKRSSRKIFLPQGVTAKRWLIAYEPGNSHQTWFTPWSYTSQLSEVKDINVCFL